MECQKCAKWNVLFHIEYPRWYSYSKVTFAQIKEFKLSSWAISNRMTVSVITFIIVLSGLLSYTGMARENFPEIIIPQIYVATPYPGNSALDVEKLITKRLEKEINSITGVDKITSNSIQGYSSIVVEFSFDFTPAEALQKVKDKVDVAMADPDFPKDLPSEPSITEMNFSERIPIMNINLSGEFSMDQLKEYAEYLEDEIEELSEISGVDIRGVQEKELEIAVDRRFKDLEDAVKAAEKDGAKPADLKKLQKEGDKEVEAIRERYAIELDLVARTWDEFKSVHSRKIIEDEMLWREMRDKYGEYFEGGTGAEAIKQLINRIDFDEEEIKLREAIETLPSHAISFVRNNAHCLGIPRTPEVKIKSAPISARIRSNNGFARRLYKY